MRGALALLFVTAHSALAGVGVIHPRSVLNDNVDANITKHFPIRMTLAVDAEALLDEYDLYVFLSPAPSPLQPSQRKPCLTISLRARVNRWYPNKTELAKQNFAAINATISDTTHVEAQQQKWDESGLKLNDLVSLSVLDSTNATTAAAAAVSNNNNNTTSQELSLLDERSDACAGDCSQCDKCQNVCITLVLCLPCWGM